MEKNSEKKTKAGLLGAGIVMIGAAAPLSMLGPLSALCMLAGGSFFIYAGVRGPSDRT